MFYRKALVVVLLTFTSLTLGQENTVLETEVLETEVLEIEQFDSENGLQELQLQIPSPLLSAQQDHGKLYQSAYDPEHQLYPVKIVAIDDWQLPAGISKQDILLSEGQHQMIVVPDFSNIEHKTVFMDSPWQELQVSFSIEVEQEIVVAARLMDTEDLQWQVQMYLVDTHLEQK